MTTTNKNFRVKNGLEVGNAIGVGANGTSFGTAGQILSSNGTASPATWIDNYTSSVKHEVKLGESIAKGQAVYVSSASGTNMLVSKASNATEATSSKTLGLTQTSGATNDFVYVVTEGLVSNIDTSAANTEGDPVWLGTSGNLIYGLTNKPIAPAHLVFIGVVTRKSATVGEIFVRVQNGFELNEIHNVLIGTNYSSTPADNNILAYDSANALWTNQTAEQAGLANLSGATFTGNVNATTFNGSGAGLTSIPNSALVNNSITINGNAIALGGSITIAGGGGGNSFETISANGTSVVADSSTDTLTLTPSNGITITGNATSDTITISTNASDANGASTIVARDASGNFTAGQVTANISTLSIYSAVTNNKIFSSSTGVIGEAGGASYFVGNGSNLTSITLANVTGLSTALDGKANLSGATFTGDIAVNGGDITTTSTTATLYNTTATTVHIGNAANVTLGNIAHSGNVTVNNDLVVYGNIIFNNGASEISATTIQVDDTLISLADNNTADESDIGFYAGYTNATVGYHTGFVRDANDSGIWKLFSNVTTQPTGTVLFTNAIYDTLKLGNLTAVANVNAVNVTASNVASSYVIRATSSYLDTDILSSTTHGLQIGATAGSHLKITNSQIQSVTSGVGNALDINQYGGGVNFGLNGVVPMGLNGTLTIENTQGPTKIPLTIFANATQSAPVSIWYSGGGASVLASISNVGTFTARNIVSTVAVGTAPFTVTSNTTVANLSANLLNGYTISTATPDTIVLRSNIGNFTANTITANLNATTVNATTVNVTGQLISTVATGTAPLSVASTTKVANLTADKVGASFFVTVDSGSTENTDLYTFNGSAQKQINIVAGTNISLGKTANTITISSTSSGGESLSPFLLMGG